MTKAPPSTNPSATDTTNSSIQNRKNKRKTTTAKISEIAKSLQNQEIENNNNDQEKIDDDVEIIEVNEETIDDEGDDDVQTKAKPVTRSKKRKTNKG